MLLLFFFLSRSRLNFYLFGLKPIWFHLTNILMHAIVCVLFTRVCIIVAGLKNNFAIIAGILFAVHPIHTEAVSVHMRHTRSFIHSLLLHFVTELHADMRHKRAIKLYKLIWIVFFASSLSLVYNLYLSLNHEEPHCTPPSTTQHMPAYCAEHFQFSARKSGEKRTAMRAIE